MNGRKWAKPVNTHTQSESKIKSERKTNRLFLTSFAFSIIFLIYCYTRFVFSFNGIFLRHIRTPNVSARTPHNRMWYYCAVCGVVSLSSSAMLQINLVCSALFMFHLACNGIELAFLMPPVDAQRKPPQWTFAMRYYNNNINTKKKKRKEWLFVAVAKSLRWKRMSKWQQRQQQQRRRLRQANTSATYPTILSQWQWYYFDENEKSRENIGRRRGGSWRVGCA